MKHIDDSSISMYEKILHSEVAGNFCALGVIPIADSEHELVLKYIELMKESSTRKFHSYQYIWSCLLYVREFSQYIQNTPLAIASLLFHKIGYMPGDKLSTRRTCEIAKEFYPGKLSVELFGRIKAAQTEISLLRRYGDDRDIIADIANNFYGTLDYESFKKVWGQILLEFQGAGYSPKKFKSFSRLRLKKMLKLASTCGIYRTPAFSHNYGRQAISNIKQMLEEI